MKLIISVILITVPLILTEEYRLDNYSLFRVSPSTEDSIQLLIDLSKDPTYDFWTRPNKIGDPVDVLVAPENQAFFRESFNEQEYEIVFENIQEEIDKEQKPFLRNTDSFSWTQYQPLEKIYDWLRSLSKTYPDKVKLVEAGQSYEDRVILGVKVSFHPENNLRAVWIDSLIHAREWITGATSTYILNEILTNQDPEVRAQVEKFDWYIFPVLNPDGYEYTQLNRLWRKNRNLYDKPVEFFSEICNGVDLNRNWEYAWTKREDLECTNISPGKSPFSEVELSTLHHYLRSIQNKLKIAITLHSYGQYILTPNAYSKLHFGNYDDLITIANAAGETIYGLNYTKEYKVGSASDTFATYGGSMIDWLKEVLNVPVVLQYKLRPSYEDPHGFLLPPDQIIPTGTEIFASLITVLKKSVISIGEL